MDHYIDVTLLPDADFTAPFLMGVTFNKLHRVLAELASEQIAISFPDYPMDAVKRGKKRGLSLGKTLRLHGTAASLDQLMSQNWLTAMTDHLRHSNIQPVPQQHDWIQVKRVQCRSNIQRVRERQMRRKGYTLAEAIEKYPDELEQEVHLPFVQAKSGSSGQQFRFFIRQKISWM